MFLFHSSLLGKWCAQVGPPRWPLRLAKLNGLQLGNGRGGTTNWKEYKEDPGIPEAIETFIAKALAGQEPEYIKQVTDLITRMIEPDSQLRTTPEQLKNHPLPRDK